MLDEDLARLYGVETKRLNEQVRRNPDRFPDDFMFELTEEEWVGLKSQNATSRSHGGRRKLPKAFTQEGVSMLSSVLNSKQAIAVNVEIMRTFARLRTYLASQEKLAATLQELELRFERKAHHHDEKLKLLAEAMRQLRTEVRALVPPPKPLPPKRRMGFHHGEETES